MDFKKLFRIYIKNQEHSSLAIGNIITLDYEIKHYVQNVIKIKNEGLIKVFNQVHGEFLAQVIHEKKSTHLIIKRFIRLGENHKHLHLGLCLIQNNKMSQVIDQAVQLGVTHIHPIISDKTKVHNFNVSRYEKIIIEATEQSDRMDLAQISLIGNLKTFLDNKFELVIFADISQDKNTVLNIETFPQNLACIVGPEGGFSQQEQDYINSFDNVFSVSLGKNTLRAETATITLISQISLLRK